MVARMTVHPMTEMPLLEDLMSTSIGFYAARGHIRCCVSEPPKFLCGAPFHPECDIAEEMPEINCADCKKIRRRFICRIGHQHCPLRLTALEAPVCPKKGSS
jgi:hypothetical protein